MKSEINKMSNDIYLKFKWNNLDEQLNQSECYLL